MDLFVNLGIGIAASGISFVLGIMLRTITDNYRIRRSRDFWGKGIGSGKIIILLGSFADKLTQSDPTSPAFEPTGVVGLGDARAAHELAVYFTRLGVAADIAYANSPLAGQGKSNIVLLGAEETNPLVKGAFDGVVSTFRYETSQPMTLHDGLRNKSYVAKLAGDQVAIDYGTLIRARNPYAPEHTLVMIGGIYGFGTWGGVRLLNDKRFIKQCALLSGRSKAGDAFDIECVYRVRVHQGEAEFVTPLDIRPLSRPAI
jgi:hypothetical protein